MVKIFLILGIYIVFKLCTREPVCGTEFHELVFNFGRRKNDPEKDRKALVTYVEN